MWKILAGAGGLVLAGFLIIMFGNARAHEGRMAERSERLALDLQDAKTIADQRVAGEQRVTAAIGAYADRAAALKPLVITSHDTVTNYAQDPAGHVLCRAAERVQSVDALDAALFPATTSAPSGKRAGPVPSDGAAPPG